MSANPWPYIIFCFAITLVTLLAYYAYFRRKGAELSKHVAPEDRRWMN